MAKKKSKSNKFSKLINTGPKKLAVFILVFAIIGGGVAAYRTFAATDCGDPSVGSPYIDGSRLRVNMDVKCRYSKQKLCIYMQIYKGSSVKANNEACANNRKSVIAHIDMNKSSVCGLKLYGTANVYVYRDGKKKWVSSSSGPTRTINC